MINLIWSYWGSSANAAWQYYFRVDFTNNNNESIHPTIVGSLPNNPGTDGTTGVDGAWIIHILPKGLSITKNKYRWIYLVINQTNNNLFYGTKLLQI